MFTDIFDQYNNTIVAGPNINCELYPHVQSFFIVFNIVGLDLMLDTFRCINLGESKFHWVLNTEVVYLKILTFNFTLL